MSSDGEVRYEREGHVARVTIDRPKVLNALDSPSTERLNDIWAEIEADRTVRVIVLTGAGDRSFCAGADMSPSAVERTGLEYWAQSEPYGFGGLCLRTSLNVPIIARVNGYALGGGMGLLCGCDIIVAADHAEFGLTEPRVGRLPLEGGITKFVRRVPYAHAMGMLLTGRMANAAEMARIGFVNEVVPADDLDAAVQRWIEQILACAPTALRAIKQVVQETSHLTPHEADAVRLPELMASLASEDSQEGLLAFQQKRPPDWPGR